MLSQEIRNLILQFRNLPPKDVALKLSGKELPVATIVQQIEGWQKTKAKLPLWHATENIVFPVRLSLEQSSSELTAAYKAQMVKKGNLIDLTGGFGVDSFYFSQQCKIVTYVEQNIALYEIAKYNFELLEAQNIFCLNENGIDTISKSDTKFETIYIDPARRNISGKKVFQLEDCEPNVIENIDLLLGKSNQILIKTAPLLDIDKTLNDLKYTKEVHVVSVDNECKEVLYLLEDKWEGEEKLLTINFLKHGEQRFEFHRTNEKSAKVAYSEPLQYVYEPNASILKAGAFRSIAEAYSLNKIAQNTHLYTSNVLIHEFPGRVFEIKFTGKEAEIIQKVKDQKANVITRNYPLTAEQLKTKLKIKDGGEAYILGFKKWDQKPVIALCQRIQ